VGLLAPVSFTPPGRPAKPVFVTPFALARYTLYEVASATASQRSVTCPLDVHAVRPIGTGSARGVADTSEDSTLSPDAFTAVTTKWYVVPFSSPDSTCGLETEACRAPPGSCVQPSLETPPAAATYSTYEVAPADPVQLTLTLPSRGVASTAVGAAGTGSGVADASLESPLSPASFTALTTKWYVVPFARPAATWGLVTPATRSPPGSPLQVARPTPGAAARYRRYDVAPATGFQETVTRPSPGAAVTPSGGAGGRGGSAWLQPASATRVIADA